MSGGTHHPIPEFRDADHFWGPGLSQVVNGSHEIIRPKPRRWVHIHLNIERTMLQSYENRTQQPEIENQQAAQLNISLSCAFKKEKNNKAKKKNQDKEKMNSLCPGYSILYRPCPGVFNKAFSQPNTHSDMYTHIGNNFRGFFLLNYRRRPLYISFSLILIAVSNWGRELISSRFFSSPFFLSFIYVVFFFTRNALLLVATPLSSLSDIIFSPWPLRNV